MSSIVLREAVVTATGLLEPFVGVFPDRSLGSPVPQDLQALGALGRRQQAQVLAHLAAHHAEGMHVAEGFRSTADWWAQQSGCSLARARADVVLAARTFTGDLQATGGALLGGSISRDQAWEVHQGTKDCHPDLAMAIEAMLLIDPTMGPERMRELATQARRLAMDEESEQEAWERQQRSRQLTLTEIGDMWVLHGLLTPEVGLLLKAVLEALAKPMPPAQGERDQRAACQRRHDALEQALTTFLAHASATKDAAGRHHAPARAQFVFSAADLAGMVDPATSSDHAAARQCCDADVTFTHVQRSTDEPVEPAAPVSLNLVSDVPAEDPSESAFPEDDPDDHGDEVSALAPRPTLDSVASALLAECLKALPPVFSRIPLEVLDQGRLKRFVTEGQRLALGVRDGGCVGPGCHAPPSQCHAHHIVHWLLGGPTSLHNLALLCSFHHHLVHEGGWTLRRRSDGTWEALPPQRQALAA